MPTASVKCFAVIDHLRWWPCLLADKDVFQTCAALCRTWQSRESCAAPRVCKRESLLGELHQEHFTFSSCLPHLRACLLDCSSSDIPYAFCFHPIKLQSLSFPSLKLERAFGHLPTHPRYNFAASEKLRTHGYRS